MPIMDKNYRLKIVENKDEYEGLRALWCEVFGDELEFVDAVYANFGEDIKGYVAISEGSVISALSCYRCGDFEDRPVYVSYAICTAEGARGCGIGGSLTEYARDSVTAEGGISIVSPAEASLETFYAKLGYEPFFLAAERAALIDLDEDYIFDEEDDEYEKANLGLRLERIDAIAYGKYREAYLTGRPHIELSGHMLRLVQAESILPDGSSGLCSVNGGDAICALGTDSAGRLIINELLLNPVLAELSLEIDNEIAERIAESFGTDAVIYRMPGRDRCQAMAAGLTGDEERSDTEEYIFKEAYFGFPIE